MLQNFFYKFVHLPHYGNVFLQYNRITRTSKGPRKRLLNVPVIE